MREGVAVWPSRSERILGRLSLVKQCHVMFLAWLPYSRGTLQPDGTFRVTAAAATGAGSGTGTGTAAAARRGGGGGGGGVRSRGVAAGKGKGKGGAQGARGEGRGGCGGSGQGRGQAAGHAPGDVPAQQGKGRSLRVRVQKGQAVVHDPRTAMPSQYRPDARTSVRTCALS